jgi:hypothetical protein
VAKGPLASIIPFTMLFYGAPFFFFYQHGWHVEGVTIIESFSSMRLGDPLGGPLFVLAHYRAFLDTIVQASNCVYPSLVDDIHIMGPMSKITYAFDHLSTQLTLVGLKVKILNFKL